jgi:transposase-like protein
MTALQRAFDRIRQRIDVDANGCWNWRGSLDSSSYGSIRVDDKVWRTHRVTYTVIHGVIPRGKVVRHKCDNAQCCNPMHLEIGDHEDNTQDIVDRKRHERRGVTPEEREQIVAMRRAGATKRQIATETRRNWYVVSRVLDETGVDVIGKKGRPRGSRNAHVRVTEEMKAKMRQIYATGKHSQQDLAEQFGCDQTYVSLIVRGKK